MSNLPEKTIVSNGCHDCVFANETHGYIYWCYIDRNLSIGDNVLSNTRNNECPLLTQSIKVVKNENN
jgi:hypothetical protein